MNTVVVKRARFRFADANGVFHTFIAPNRGVCERLAILAEFKKEPVEAPKKSSSGFSLPMVLLIVALVIAAVVAGIGLTTSSGATVYGCMSISNQGGNVKIDTSGIIHVAGSQYYVTCAEGDANPTTSTSVSCLTINPHTETYTYPDSGTETWYYLSAPGHTITIPPVSVNSTEVLQPTTSTITVTC